MTALLEHTNFTVANPVTTAAWMEKVFGWHIRWQGASKDGGISIHIGGKKTYLALYTPKGRPAAGTQRSYDTVGGLNHMGLIVEDLDAAEQRVKDAGFEPHHHADYDPGRRFYFFDDNGIEFELVEYD